MLKRICIVAMLLLTCAGAVWADRDVAETEVAALTAKAIEERNGEALRELGIIYLESGDSEKYGPGLELLTKAAEFGDAEAMLVLGFAYFDGEIIAKDLAQTEALWQKAAELGNVSAAYSLGSFYFHGFNGAPDAKKAVEWYEKAYDMGSPLAAYDLGIIYKDGLGMPKTPILARLWLEKGVACNDVNAKCALGAIYYNGEGVSIDYAKAYSYLKDADVEESGHPESLYYLGELYRMGLYAPKNEAKALECYETAAVQNYGPAQCSLGHMYYLAQGGAKDIVKAYMWYSLAEDNAVPKADEMAAYCAKEMTGAEMGRAQVALARAYAFGYGAGQDYMKAYRHLYLAGKYGEDVTAMTANILAHLSEKDIFTAESWGQDWLAARGLKAN